VSILPGYCLQFKKKANVSPRKNTKQARVHKCRRARTLLTVAYFVSMAVVPCDMVLY
jgi:hypothetical protein